MPLFRRNTAEVVRRGVGDESTEEFKTRKVGGKTVKVRRVRRLPAPPANGRKKTRAAKAAPARNRRRKAPARPQNRPGRPRTAKPHIEAPGAGRPETGRKQMLVRVLPHQTQVVVLEGSLLVEHYVHRSDQESLVGNIYMSKVKSVLPGLEAAFLDIGAEKNGVIYAGRPQLDPAHPRAGPPHRAAAQSGPAHAGAGGQGPDGRQGAPADQPGNPSRPPPGPVAAQRHAGHIPEAAGVGAPPAPEDPSSPCSPRTTA